MLVLDINLGFNKDFVYIISFIAFPQSSKLVITVSILQSTGEVREVVTCLYMPTPEHGPRQMSCLQHCCESTFSPGQELPPLPFRCNSPRRGLLPTSSSCL